MKPIFSALIGIVLGVSTAAAQNLCPGLVPAVASGPPLLTSTQVRQLVDEYYAAVRSLDPDRYAAAFAEDGSLEDPVGTPPTQGRDAIKLTYSTSPLAFDEVNMLPTDVYAPSLTNEAAARWSVTLRVRGTGVVINNVSGITYFRFDNDCLIRSARVFWNPVAIAANATP